MVLRVLLVFGLTLLWASLHAQDTLMYVMVPYAII